jgi:hypothetical protein
MKGERRDSAPNPPRKRTTTRKIQVYATMAREKGRSSSSSEAEVGSAAEEVVAVREENKEALLGRMLAVALSGLEGDRDV